MKPVIDVCCGSKMFYFDKNNPLVLFQDIRSESHELCDGRNLNVSPDLIQDFTKQPHADNSFYHVVFDPPHLDNLGLESYMGKKYGRLQKDNWQGLIKSGFEESMRILKPYGTLIFKWNETRIKVSELLNVIGVEPLYGHRTLQTSKTIWLCFIKTPESFHNLNF